MIACGPTVASTSRSVPSGMRRGGIPGCSARPGTSRREITRVSAAEPRIRLDPHLISAAELVEIVHVHRTEIGLQRVEDVVHLHAHLFGLLAIDVEVDLRHAGHGTCEPMIGEISWRFLASSMSASVRSWSTSEPDGFAVLDLHLEAAGEAEPHDGRRDDHERHSPRAASRIPSAESCASISCTLSGVLPLRSSRSRPTKAVAAFGAPFDRASRSRRARTSSRPSLAPGTAEDGFIRSITSWVRSSDAASGSCTAIMNVALVLVGEEALGRFLVQPSGAARRRRGRRAAPATRRGEVADEPGIGVLDGPVDGFESPARTTLVLATGRRYIGALSRLERQGVDGADERRGGDRQGELPVHLPGDAAQERRRQEHGHQHQRDGDDRAGHLAHGLDGRGSRRHRLSRCGGWRSRRSRWRRRPRCRSPGSGRTA